MKNKIKTVITDKKFIKWLREHGCPDFYSSFILIKGMGERMELEIVNDKIVELTWYGRPKNKSLKILHIDVKD
jgi:hypothetical protein